MLATMPGVAQAPPCQLPCCSPGHAPLVTALQRAQLASLAAGAARITVAACIARCLPKQSCIAGVHPCLQARRQTGFTLHAILAQPRCLGDPNVWGLGAAP